MQRFSWTFLVTLCISANLLAAADDPKFTPEQQEVVNVYNKMHDAARKRDMAAWSTYVADDCIFSDDDGQIKTKSEIIEIGRKLPFAYDHFEDARDFMVHVYGNTAVLNFRFTVHEQFTDTDILTEMRQTETFIRRDGSWILVARQWGALPVNFRKPAAADPSKYKDYIGEYEWRPGLVDQVSVKDGRLLTRMNNESKDTEYLPLSRETYFLKDDLGSVTFVRDAKGNVNGYTYHRLDGQQIHVKKIK